MKKTLMVAAVATALTVAVFAASSGPKAITVGDFAVRVSRALGKVAPTREAAAANLKAAGVGLSKDLSAQLTEAEAARILNDLGISATTRTPQGTVSGARADQLALAIGQGSIASVAASLPQDGLPTACLQASNRGACQNCCKVTFGCTDPNAPCDFSATCSKFCKQVLPPGQASPSEPPP